VTGLSRGEASTLITTAGFVVSELEVMTSDQTLEGIVKSYSPEGFLDLGEVITIEVWKWDGTTTTTTTTTTTAP